MMNIDQLKNRYQNDPRFHNMVAQALHVMESCQAQPYEVRDAVFLAEVMFNERHVKPMYIGGSDWGYAPLREKE